jgi:hypothetical protein
MSRRANRNTATAALNAGGFTTVGTLPIGTLQAVLTIDDGSAAEVRCDSETVSEQLSAGGGYVVWDASGAGPLGTPIAVKAKASAGTPTAKLVYTLPEG